jgi:hypothetical protein
LLAGTATLTGLLTAVAASALPGKSVKSATSATASRQVAASSTESGGAGEGSTLQAAAQQPQAFLPSEGAESSGAAPYAPVVSGGS